MNSFKEHANRILEIVENDLLAARARRDEIEEAIGMLANAGVSDELLAPLHTELRVAKEDVKEALLHRILVRDGMHDHHWLDK